MDKSRHKKGIEGAPFPAGHLPGIWGEPELGPVVCPYFLGKPPSVLKSCNFETDDWEAYQSIIPPAQHKVGKDLTFYIEGFNATIRAMVSRLVRRSLSFSKLDKWHDLAIGWFTDVKSAQAFWQFNLELQHYI